MHPPPDLEHLWAKSKRPDQRRGESLVAHTREVMRRLAALARLRPGLAVLVDCPRLWHRLFWACLLHDLGKAAAGFQAAVRGQPHRWSERRYRHEVGSLAFVHWFFDERGDDYPWVVAAIAAHHKDAARIAAGYPPIEDADDDPVADIVSQIAPADVAAIWRWLVACPADWLAELGLTGLAIDLLPPPPFSVVERFPSEARQRVQRALRTYERFVQAGAPGIEVPLVLATIVLRGLTVTADHLGSAHAPLLPGLSETFTSLLGRLTPADGRAYTPYPHQAACAAQPGSALLNAPTSSGKTEAGVAWAIDDQGRLVPRVFYALPYQASMNAMYARLQELFPGQVGLQHGRALAALYRRLSMAEDRPADVFGAARWARNLVSLHALPITVFSPYQMLKALYRLRGYEAMLTDYAGAAFIFDEIHAYEPCRLALILALMTFLQQRLGARHLVMSATFPTLVRRQLEGRLGIGPAQVVTATAETFRDFQRHQLRLLDGDLLVEGLPRIMAAAREGRSVLVCCNTVARAQALYALLPDSIERVLIHGRFTVRDRQTKEQTVQAATGATSTTRRPMVVVATQVVEVSLNIDLDTIFTDPAPLEALIQRFGRVNRRRRQRLAEVFVFRQPADGQGIYRPDLVAATLAILEREVDRPIDEAAVGGWLDAIYSGPVADDWQREFDTSWTNCERACLRPLRAFDSDDRLIEEFYKAFDGVDVLPNVLEREYFEILADEPVRASELLVPISYRQYQRLARAGRVMREGEDGLKVVRADYSDEVGLMLDV